MSQIKPKVVDGNGLDVKHEGAHDGHFIDGTFVRHKGMSWFITGLFLIGELAGGGLVTLPVVTVRTSKLT